MNGTKFVIASEGPSLPAAGVAIQEVRSYAPWIATPAARNDELGAIQVQV